MTKKDFYQAVGERRSRYAISPKTTISEEKIIEVIEYAIKNAPSAFNSQSQRVVVAFGEHHKKVWEAAKNILKGMLPPEAFKATEEKLNSFEAGYGTVLYFEDQQTVEGLQKQFPTYAANFPIWSQQASGMLQYIIWTAFAAEGLGATLQHYSPLIDAQVAKDFGVPASWKLIAQMPFGVPTAEAGPKDFLPIEQRLKVFK